jgi:hypothetical protein
MSKNNHTFDPIILELCAKVEAKRAKTVIDHLLEYGSITTEELSDRYGYDHPPRAARDVREQGIPLVTGRTVSPKTGRKIGIYTFGDPSAIKRGRIGGRKAFSKAFKEALIQRFGERDALTLDPVGSRYLQIDHRIPYEVAGESMHDETNLNAYMLLDGSSQRAKSFSCENCQNLIELLDLAKCQTCYWAYPENYNHVAMKPIRRLDLQWSGDAVKDYDRLKSEAQKLGVSVSELARVKLDSK